MRALAFVFLSMAVVATSCAGGPDTADMLPYPDWRGPVVHVRHRGDRGLEVEMTAPSGGHQFVLRDVVLSADGQRADARFSHRTPTAAGVTQALVRHRLEVAPTQLGDARVVCVWVARDDQPAQLAVATSRP